MKRLLSSPCASRGLAYLLQSKCKIYVNTNLIARPKQLVVHKPATAIRLFSNGSDDDDDDDKPTDDDPFGLSFDDGDDYGKVGPASQLPPKYRRDLATGKLTGDVEQEVSPQDLEVLRMTPVERDQHLLEQIAKTWDDKGASDDFARRVRMAKMALNVLGRSVTAQAAKTKLDDGAELGRDQETGFTQNFLTQSEFETFARFMKQQYEIDITPDDIPVHDRNATKKTSKSPLDLEEDIYTQGITDDSEADPDNPDLSLKWMTSRAKWEVSKTYGSEHPFDDMHPRDLQVKRLVNRKQAKPIPVEILHHNNLALLRRYISPAGQIMHRSRTRLGARDQRRVARLIKRARKLGLIPHAGQFKVEVHGDIYEKDIHVKKPWEKELERRGLVIQNKIEAAKSDEEWVDFVKNL